MADNWPIDFRKVKMQWFVVLPHQRTKNLFVILFSVTSVLNGGAFDIGASKLIEKVIDMTNRFRMLQIDRTELVCLKFLILFDAKGMLFIDLPYNCVIFRFEAEELSVHESSDRENQPCTSWVHKPNLSRARRPVSSTHHEIAWVGSNKVQKVTCWKCNLNFQSENWILALGEEAKRIYRLANADGWNAECAIQQVNYSDQGKTNKVQST